MTSTEIIDYMEQQSEALGEDVFRASLSAPLWEIAKQLAIINESRGMVTNDAGNVLMPRGEVDSKIFNTVPCVHPDGDCYGCSIGKELHMSDGQRVHLFEREFLRS